MHNWRGFITTSDLNFTCMLSCMFMKTIPVEKHFPAIKIFVVSYDKMSTQGQIPKTLAWI